uniref:RRM domain-containing protein n=1 Tax=Meloidogyne incognita TaxID=6306 RepID=A0A914KU66_MELIC
MELNDQYERTLYVCNFDEKVDDKLLEEIFVQAGPIESVTIREKVEKTSSAGKSPERFRFAFVEFSHVESVLFACKIMDAIELYGRKLKVTPRDSTKQKEIYTKNGMREKSFELHREQNNERSDRRERNRSDGFEQRNQLFHYPDQPTPINQLGDMRDYQPGRIGDMKMSSSWSAPVLHYNQPVRFYEDNFLPPPPPPPPMPLFNTPKTTGQGSHKMGQKSKQNNSLNKSQQSTQKDRQSNNKNSQPQRYSWPRPYQR